MVLRLDRRNEIEVRDLPVEDRAAAFPERGTRDHRRMADVAPYAPLLIRIVKFPYALQPERGGRVRVIEPAEREVRPRWESPMREVEPLRKLPTRADWFPRRGRPERILPSEQIREALLAPCQDDTKDPPA